MQFGEDGGVVAYVEEEGTYCCSTIEFVSVLLHVGLGMDVVCSHGLRIRHDDHERQIDDFILRHDAVSRPDCINLCVEYVVVLRVVLGLLDPNMGTWGRSKQYPHLHYKTLRRCCGR